MLGQHLNYSTSIGKDMVYFPAIADLLQGSPTTQRHIYLKVDTS